MKTQKLVSILVPPDMQKELLEFSKEEQRSASEIIYEAFRQYATNRALTDIRKAARRKLKPK